MRAVVCVALLASAAHAQPLDAAVERYTLPNGLRVVIAPDPSTAHVVVHTSTAIGAASPAAIVIERLMLRGSHHVPGDGFERAIEAAGGWTNTSLASDRTTSTTYVAPGGLALALQLEADRMVGLTIDEARVEAVRGELAVTLAEVVAARRDHYGPAATTLVIAGRVTVEDAKQLVAARFGALAKRGTPVAVAPPAPRTAPQTLDGSEGGVPKLVLAFQAPAAESRERRALDVIAYALSREKLGAELRIDHDLGLTFVLELVAPSATAREALVDRLAALRTTGLAPKVLEGALAQLDTRVVEAFENLALRAAVLARGSTLAAERAALRVTNAEVIATAAAWLAESAAITIDTTSRDE